MTQEQISIYFNVNGNMGNLQGQIAALNKSLIQNAQAMTMMDAAYSKKGISDAYSQFRNMTTASGLMTSSIVSLDTHTQTFAKNLATAGLTNSQLWRESLGYLNSTKRTMGEINSLAQQQVRMGQSKIIPMGMGPAGQMQAMVSTPTSLISASGNTAALAAKQWEIFNATAQQGLRNVVSMGKNVQWAGRQLMVGFTVPLMIIGGLAAKTFNTMDQELVRLSKVYGEGFTFGQDYVDQTEMVRAAGVKMANDMAKAYGQAGEETIALMADLAAVGIQGEELNKMTEQTTRLTVLGEIERADAMRATVAMQTVFKMSTDEVATSVNFLNAVENQTSASLGDLTQAIPRAGTVVEGLGGSMEDLALYMVAFREGGITAAEGANALKSGLSSLIAPSKMASDFLKGLGINLENIVLQNQGDLTGTLLVFQEALSGLSKLEQQQAITKLFGKYQFARMNAFFNNLNARGSQTQKVLELMNRSSADLARTAQQEIDTITQSASGQFKIAWAAFKVQISAAGEDILKLGTKIINLFSGAFNFISEHKALQTFITWILRIGVIIGPLIMVVGLLGNAIGMVSLGILKVVNAFKVLMSGGAIKNTFVELTTEGFAAANSVESLSTVMYDQSVMTDLWNKSSQNLIATLKELNGVMGQVATSRNAVVAGSGLDLGLKAQGTYTRPGVGLFAGTDASNKSLGANARNFSAMSVMPMSGQKLMAQATVLDLTEKYANTPKASEFHAQSQALAIANTNAVAAQKALAAGTGSSEQQAIAQRELKMATDVATKSVLNQAEADRRALLVRTQSGRMQLAAENAGRELALQSSGVFQGKSGSNATTAGHIGIIGGYNTLAAREQGLMSKTQSTEMMSLVSNDMIRLDSSVKASSLAFEHLTPSSWTLDKRMQYVATGLQNVEAPAADLARRMYAAAAAGQGLTLTEEELAAGSAQLLTAVQQRAVAEKTLTSAVESSAINIKSVSGTPISMAGTAKLNQAILAAAAKIDSTGISLQQITVGGSKYVAALTSSGAILEGTTFQINKAGSTQAISMEKYSAALTNANASAIKGAVSLDQLAASSQIAALSNKQESTASLAAAGADNIEAAASLGAANRSWAYNPSYGRMGTTAPQMAVPGVGMGWGAYNPGQAGTPMVSPGAASRFTTARVGGGIGANLSRFKSAGGAGMGSAAMMLPMVASMMLPQGSVAGNVASGAQMGAMAGMLAGPWGMAIGAVGGAITAGIGEALGAAQRRSEEEAAKAAAAWELEFGAIDLTQEMASALKLGKIDIFKTPAVDLSGSGVPITSKSTEYSAAVTEQFATQIDDLKKAEDPTAAADWGKNFYTNLVASGVEAEKAYQLLSEILSQADQLGSLAEIAPTVKKITIEKEAEQALLDELKDTGRAATQALVDSITAESRTDSVADELKDAAGQIGESYFNGLQDAFDTGALNIDTYYKKMEQGGQRVQNLVLKGIMDTTELNADADAIAAIGKATGTTGTTIEQMVEQSQSLSDIGWGDLVANLEGPGINALSVELEGLGYSADTIYKVRDAFVLSKESSNEFYQSLYDSSDSIRGATDRYMDLYDGMSLASAAQMALTDAVQEYQRQLNDTAMSTGFTTYAQKHMDDPVKPVNLNKIERQQGREQERLQESEADKLELLQESEDKRLENMQDAVDKRERLMQREIDQTTRAYDKEIAQIDRAEQKRQDQMAAEEARFARREEMRNMEISYDEAIAGGDLFEAARIRLDINATRAQNERDTAEERRQKEADKKVKEIEKQRNQEVRSLEKALRIEERMNQRAIESAQEASQAKIEAAQEASDAAIAAAEKAHKQELQDQKELNKDLGKEQQDQLAQSERVWNLYAKGRGEDAMALGKELGLTAKEQAVAINKGLIAIYGSLPSQLNKAVEQDIIHGNWGNINQLMEAVLSDAPMSRLKEIMGLSKTTGNIPGVSAGNQDPTRFLSGGGPVYGGGTATSDSIPARLSKGEYVIRQRSVAKYGQSFFDALNDGKGSRLNSKGGTGFYAEGGIVGPITRGILSPALEVIMNMLMKGRGAVSAISAKPGEYGDTFLSAEQLKNAAIILSVGKGLGAGRRELLSGLMTAMQESRLINVNYGADDSLGLFQQRPSMGWGTPKQVMNPLYSSKQYFNHLLDVQNRNEMSLGEMAQAVQRSAYPGAYTQWADEARAILSATKFRSTGSDDPRRNRMVNFLKNQLGEPYIFGASGPDAWDCSGLTMMAAAQAGISIPHSASLQQRMSKRVTLGNQSPGDLAFFNPEGWSGAAGHVGMMIGGGQFIHAPNPSLPVMRSSLGTTSNEFLNIGRLPGLKSGASFVKYDDTLANLHRGESVLTAPLTRKFTESFAGPNNSEYNINIIVNDPSSDVDVERAILTAMDKRERKLGRNRTVK